jgi:hypothetical protein
LYGVHDTYSNVSRTGLDRWAIFIPWCITPATQVFK